MTQLSDTAREALAALRQVQREFPHPRLMGHIEAVEAGKADHWRDAGLVLIAAAAHARSPRGALDIALCEKNTNRVKEILGSVDIPWQA